MKKRFLVRIILFVIVAVIIAVALVSGGTDKSYDWDATLTDDYYGSFFGLADGVAEMRDAVKRKFYDIGTFFIDFVEGNS